MSQRHYFYVLHSGRMIISAFLSLTTCKSVSYFHSPTPLSFFLPLFFSFLLFAIIFSLSFFCLLFSFLLFAIIFSLSFFSPSFFSLSFFSPSFFSLSFFSPSFFSLSFFSPSFFSLSFFSQSFFLFPSFLCYSKIDDDSSKLEDLGIGSAFRPMAEIFSSQNQVD
ncbi:unnamed protein product [Acanthosepion pharaonis]|uniref:Uncharacterized protein n=1 Tax=Acanthosepion pharaonis TaxID=158019 RepID=A0A812B3B9_ACAPH|nr:unnamed protein product [Sepia pharaonis]